jgi:hypothetical protein
MDRRINKSFEEVCQDIVEKKCVEHVGAYELMRHDKMQRQCFMSDQAARMNGTAVSPFTDSRS